MITAPVAGRSARAEPAEQDSLVVPESPKEPADSSLPGCSGLAAGRLSASQPLSASVQIQLPCNEDLDTDHAAVGASCDLTQAVASKVLQELPPIDASDHGHSSNERRLISKQLPHVKPADMLLDVETGQQAVQAADSSANNPLQPAEFDVIVDALPAGTSSIPQCTHAISPFNTCKFSTSTNKEKHLRIVSDALNMLLD